MADPRGAPSKLVGRGGLLGQVALVASAALGQSVAAQAPRQSDWVGGAGRRGPEVAWCGVEYVHGERNALYQPSASCSARLAERIVQETWWHAVGETTCKGSTVLVVRRGHGGSHVAGWVFVTAG